MTRYLDHIEPALAIAQTQFFKIVLGCDYQLALLGRSDRLGRCTVFIRPPAPHLHENQAVAVTSNKIDLTISAAVVGRNDPVAAISKFGCCGYLGASAYSRPGRRQFAVLSEIGENDLRWHGHGPRRSMASI